MEEKAAMQISMLQRSREENVGKLYFWGKIMGETNDYLIAYALSPTFGFPTKKFFYWYQPSIFSFLSFLFTELFIYTVPLVILHWDKFLQ